MLEGKRVIIFDLDGTLIDSIGIWNAIDLELISKIYHPITMSFENIQKRRDEILRQNATEANPYLIYCEFLREQYQSNLSACEIHHLRYQIAQNYLESHVKYKPHAADFICQLRQRGLILAIATTTKRKNINIYSDNNLNIKNSANLKDFFSLIFTREDVKALKPNPEVYLKILNHLNVAPQDCLVFEDSLIGVEAAKKAGLEVVAVYDKHNANDWQSIRQLADYNIDSYSQINFSD